MTSDKFAGYEVSGESLGAIVDGFKNYPTVALGYLQKYGIVKKDQEVDRSGWYPVGPWLAALEAMMKDVGHNSMYKIGRSIPENSIFPPHITDIHSAIASIDVAYRINHRKNGVLMFDPATGKKSEGLGQYGYERSPDGNQIICVCDDPYPCDLDRGLIAAMAARFESTAKAQHDPDGPCRKKGGKSCTYIVFW